MGLLCRYHPRRHHAGAFTIRTDGGRWPVCETRDARPLGRPPDPPVLTGLVGATHLQSRHRHLATGHRTPSALGGAERVDDLDLTVGVILDAAGRARAGP